MEHPGFDYNTILRKKYVQISTGTLQFTIVVVSEYVGYILVQSINEIEDANATVNFGIMYYVTSNSIGRLNCSMKIGKEVGN